MEIIIIIMLIAILGIAGFYVYHFIIEKRLKEKQELEKQEIMRRVKENSNLDIARSMVHYSDEEKEMDLITLKQSFNANEQAYRLGQIDYMEYQKNLKSISDNLDYLERKYGC